MPVYTITGNASQSHIIFTSSDGSILTMPNNNCVLQSNEPETLRVYQSGTHAITAPISDYTGVGINNTTVALLIDTIKQNYLYN